MPLLVFPAGISPAEAGAVIFVDRIIEVGDAVSVKPREDADLDVGIIIVVAEVVMTVARRDEQVGRQIICVDDGAGRVRIA